MIRWLYLTVDGNLPIRKPLRRGQYDQRAQRQRLRGRAPARLGLSRPFIIRQIGCDAGRHDLTIPTLQAVEQTELAAVDAAMAAAYPGNVFKPALLP